MHINKVVGLVADDKKGVCNPYVKIRVLREGYECSKYKLPVQQNTRDPVYDEIVVVRAGLLYHSIYS